MTDDGYEAGHGHSALAPGGAVSEFVARLSEWAPTVGVWPTWGFVPTGHTIQVRDLGGPLDDEGAARRMRVSCGSAVEFARYALRSLGRGCIVRVAPRPDDPALLATITDTQEQEPSPDERAMIAAMHCGDIVADPTDHVVVSRAIVDMLQAAARDRGCWLRVVDLARTADLACLLGAEHPADDAQRSASWWILIGTERDDRISQLRAGRAFASVVLLLRDAGIAWSDVRPVADAPGVDQALTRSLGLIGCPQLLVHLGSPT